MNNMQIFVYELRCFVAIYNKHVYVFISVV